jgi:hypothetical protein
LRCMPNVGALRMLLHCSTTFHLEMWSLECHDLGRCEIWPGQKTWELFGHMQQKGVWLDAVTFVGVLNACASVVALSTMENETCIWHCVCCLKSHSDISKIIKNELRSTNVCEHCQSQKNQETKNQKKLWKCDITLLHLFALYKWTFSTTPSLIKKLFPS